MSEFIKESAIKLFGKSISLFPDKVVSDDNTAADLLEQRQSSPETSTSQDSKDVSGGDLTWSKEKDDSMSPTGETLTELATSSANSDETKKQGGQEKDRLSPETAEEEEPSESSASQEKTLTKLPCPRCSSMDTKFCYYNNYNANQPRHLCKNCQRYWTAGGTMRNVPVGSGRRKNKNYPFTNYDHTMVMDAFQATQADAINGIHSFKPNDFLIFGSDRPLGEFMASTLKLSERSQNCAQKNEFYEHSSRSSSATSNSTEKRSNADMLESGSGSFQDMPSQVPCFNQPPWTCPQNFVHWRSPKPPPAFGSSGFPITFNPTTRYWGCAVPSPWNVSWVSPTSSSSGPAALCRSPTSSNLRKHSREGTLLRPSNSANEDLSEKRNAERCVLIPKTLNEAASTLGIKNENTSSIDGTSFCKAFQSKGHRNSNIDINTMVLRANPAALSRSLNFHESA
ncbi:hypothetical protein Pfo_009513 [Paulownia fortunei]|nr:hypothetical protein Pfo_009513 [Paulownia fortunei]